MRKGQAIGQGKGYKNIQGRDPAVHSQSAQGIKQPQNVNVFTPKFFNETASLFNRRTKANDNLYSEDDMQFIGKLRSQGISREEAEKRLFEHNHPKEEYPSYQSIHINYDDEKSIERAEKEKTKMENLGFALVETKQLGFNKFNLIYKEEKDQLKGGLGDNKPDSAFDKKELAKGIKVEMEHTNNPEIAKEIAKDHLIELPTTKKGRWESGYYKELSKMENKLKKENKPITWNKIPNHNEWLNNSNQQLSVAYNLNGEHKGKYSVTIGDKPNSKGNRKVLLELNFKNQSSALKFANDYIKNKGVI